jgi:RNA polymerase sigma factor (TIGR02999 family)
MTTVPSAPDDVTRLLVRWSEGDAAAGEALLPLVYAELRRTAARHLRRERREHTLAPTALVHELYLRLVDQRHVTWQNRAQFFGIAAELMRRILVDAARARRAGKRGGSATVLSLEAVGDVPAQSAVTDVLVIDDAVDRLRAFDPDQARIVELRFFAGMTVEEVAFVLRRSARTVRREWRLARAWLFRELRPDDSRG